MRIESLSTGHELITGLITDTNAAYLAEKLFTSGLIISQHTIIGDNLAELINILINISNRANIAIVTGGLGPTLDDLTAEAAAKAAGVNLELNADAFLQIKNYFNKLNRVLTESNKKQAYFPVGAHIIPNEFGTAPGFKLKINQCQFYFMPGVPREMHAMFSQAILPEILAHSYAPHLPALSLRKYTCSVFNIPESELNPYLTQLKQAYPNLQFGTQVVFPEIRVNIYCPIAEAALHKAAVIAMQKLLHPFIVSFEGKSLPEVLAKKLISNNATIAIAESCTGGLISNLLTEISGSSEYFKLGIIAYANQAKINLLAIPPHLIAEHGAVSEEVAKAMAINIREKAGTTYGLATTGIAGPKGGSEDKPVGTIWIGIADKKQAYAKRFLITYGDRTQKKQWFAYAAMNALLKHIQKV